MCTLPSNSNFGGNTNPLTMQESKQKFEVNNGAIDGAYRKATGQVVRDTFLRLVKFLKKIRDFKALNSWQYLIYLL